MKLMTKAIEKKLPSIGATENEKDPMVICKLFNPIGVGTWYIMEYDAKNKLCYGYVDLHEKELGYFSLAELENIRLPLGLKIERDLHFKPKRLSEVKKGH